MLGNLHGSEHVTTCEIVSALIYSCDTDSCTALQSQKASYTLQVNFTSKADTAFWLCTAVYRGVKC